MSTTMSLTLKVAIESVYQAAGIANGHEHIDGNGELEKTNTSVDMRRCSQPVISRERLSS